MLQLPWLVLLVVNLSNKEAKSVLVCLFAFVVRWSSSPSKKRLKNISENMFLNLKMLLNFLKGSKIAKDNIVVLHYLLCL